MIEFSAVRRKERPLQDLAEGLSRDDLVRHTNEMCDHFQELIAGVEDPDTTFVPDDPEANDTFAATGEEVGLAWTLGHVIVHWTASSEEAAAHALTLARGLPVQGRSRYEGPWQEASTADFLHRRIEESRRMQLAMLDAWPDQPHLDVTFKREGSSSSLNAVGRFLGGLMHADSHREQVTRILEQARAARGVTPQAASAP